MNRHISLIISILIFSIVAITFSCSQNFNAGEGSFERAPSPSSSQSQSQTPQQPAADQASAGGLTWTAPSRWSVSPPRTMRVATYRIPAEEGDGEDAECAVFYFGPGQGGTLQANLQRWYGQFRQPDGRSSSEAAQLQESTVDGIKITVVEVSGTYLSSTAPMSPEKVKKPNFRMLGGIIEGPQGPVFFKLTGPEKTVARAAEEFEALVKSVKKE